MTILSAKGRLNRLQYFIQSFAAGVVIHALIGVLFLAVFAANRGVDLEGAVAYYGVFLFTLTAAMVGAMCLWIQFVSQIKRLHDLNQSGLWSLVNFIPGAGFFLWLVLIFARGNDTANPYGMLPA